MKRLVLVGAGHAHALVLKQFARTDLNGIEIVLVSPDVMAPYSGMIPGWLAGVYRWDACCVNFAHLCDRAGAKLMVDAVVALDTQQSTLMLESGSNIHYDWLSLNIGSTLNHPPGEGVFVLPMRPLSALNPRWEILLAHVCGLAPGAKFQVLMIGGGVAGVECVLAVQQHLMQLAPEVNFSFRLATEGADILPGMAAGAVRRLRRRLDQCGIDILDHFCADHVAPNAVVSADGRTLSTDAVLWATGAQSHAWPKIAGLSVDKNGFILIDAQLRSQSHPTIFAAGDCAGWFSALPKAGVYAVRMGPVLADNLIATIRDLPLRQYAPQSRALALIGIGDARAVAAWGPFAWQGAWVWRWKQLLDRRFVERCNES